MSINTAHKPGFYKPLLLAFGLLCICASLSAQLNFDFTAGKFMMKGTVVDIQSGKPVPYANVWITNAGKGVTCDNDGNFTIYVAKNDTLKFSSVGYMNKIIHVADVDSSHYYTLKVELIHEFIKLKEVTIYPYRDLDDFKKAFVEAKDVNKVFIPGIAPPKYSNKIPKPKFYNPFSFLYERLRHRSNANPDFKP